jgi:hypothetical protein
MGTVVNMLITTSIVSIILLCGAARLYIHKNFDVSEHFDAIAEATRRQQTAKRKLHNAQTR